MARASTTLDTFAAIAEPKRRALIEALASQSLTVSETVALMGWSQPMASKHLSVLKQVGLVSERRDGRCRIYTLNPEQLNPVRDWVLQLEAHWNNQLDNLGDYLHQLQIKGKGNER